MRIVLEFRYAKIKPDVEMASDRMSVKIIITLRFVNLEDFVGDEDVDGEADKSVLNNHGVTKRYIALKIIGVHINEKFSSNFCL